MKGAGLAALGISLIAGATGALPASAQSSAPRSSTGSITTRLQMLGCRPPAGAAAATLESIRSQIRRCIENPAIPSQAWDELTALELQLLSQFSQPGQSLSTAELTPVLASFQRQIEQLRQNLQALQQEKQQADQASQQREQALNDTIATLRSQVADLQAQRPPAATVASGALPPTTAAPAGTAASTGTGAAPTAPAAQEPPKFRPTLVINGSVNMVVGGVTGPSTSLSSNYWNSRVRSSNRQFSNEAAEFSPNLVTGATNKAGGAAYAYYRSGQSNLFFPPNGLQPVGNDVARNYAMAASWTGGKVRFDSLSRGGNLIITDPSDPNYDNDNPRTLDKAGSTLSVNLRGQPVIPNTGLGGLKNPAVTFEPVNAGDFNLKNLGEDITFSNIPLGRQDVQNLIDLGNRARELKLGDTVQETRRYITRAGDSISSIAFNNGTTASRLLEDNPKLDPSTAANAVLKQGTAIRVPVVGCVHLCQGLNTVSNGGLVSNTAFYDDLLNIAIAEYGSLSTRQQQSSRVQAAAQSFIRDLVSTTRDDDNQLSNEDFNFQRSYTFNNDVKVNFTTSFLGSDLLNITLRYRNFVPYGERGLFPALNLAYGFGSINDTSVSFDRLWWKIPVGKESSIWLGTRYKDYSFLPLRYGTFYPVEQQNYFFASGAGLADYVGAGVGVTLNNIAKNVLGGNISFGGGYIANPQDAVNPVSNDFQQRGIAGRDTRFRVPLQLGYLSKDGSMMATLNYIFNRGDTLNSFVGTNLSANPFFYDIDEFSQLGATFAWRFTDNLSINLVYNHFTYTARYDATVFGVPMVKAGDIAKAQSWMAALVVDDLFVDNSQMGLAIGQVPAIYANQSAWGTESWPFAFEAWYNFPFSDRISLQPAFFLVTNHDGYSNGGTDWGSTFRIYFNF